MGKSRYVGNKWKKHLVVSKDRIVKPHLPETRRFREKTFFDLLDKYGMVYLKPIVGSGGHGVMKVYREGDQFIVQTSKRQKALDSTRRLYRNIRKKVRHRKYLVQQGIDLITIDGRPLDFRVLLLRPHSHWKLMGIMGKHAARHMIVTNHCRGGRPITLRRALRKTSSFPEVDYQAIRSEIERIAMRAARILGSRLKIREVGLDVAIDKDQNIWVLEANTRPMFRLFRHHPQKDLHKQIARYVSQIRRRK